MLAKTNPLSFLRKALAEERFAIYCQPLLGLKTETKYPLAEVLVRMADEENALCSSAYATPRTAGIR